MELASIRVHPVKSTAIRRLERAHVGEAGLAGDREWMVVDGSGEMVSARTTPGLFTITARTPTTDDGDADLTLEAPGVPALHVAHPVAGEVPVRMFGTKELVARPAGPEADAWIRRVLDRPDLSLVWCHDPSRRVLRRGRAGDHAAFQDGYPITLLSQESADQIDSWIAQEAHDRGEPAPAPLGVDRYRPNLVVSGAPRPFAEDEWERVRIGGVELRRIGLVDRCAMTLLDPVDLTRGRDPIRTLSRHRAWDGRTWCAVHYVADVTGGVAVGDLVQAW